MPNAVELPINTSATAEEMANEIFGSGASVNFATYSGDAVSSAIYDNTNGEIDGIAPGPTGVLLSTGRAEDFTNSSGSTNTNTAGGTTTNTAGGINGDADFNALAGGNNTFDASFLEINFTPQGDQITVDFVIASEEYPEYVNSQYLDVVGVWVNGVEATVSIGDGTASVGNINGAATPNLYNDNTGDAFNTEMDGFTITLTFVAPVNPNQPNTLKIGVADVSDTSYDTNLLIAGGSVQSSIVAGDDQVSLGNNDTKIVDVLDNDSSTGGTLSVTHINGTAVVAGSTVTLGTGQDITLNADGTFTVEGDSDNETVYFNYTVEDTAGNTDSAIVEINQTPCFSRGTPVDTDRGLVSVEDLRVGDTVSTRDGGNMQIRWIGFTQTPAQGQNCPVRIKAGTFGATRDIVVSPNHRILLRDAWAELMFGDTEVLVKAKDLVNHTTVLWDHSGPTVDYFHILLDSHQILDSAGLLSESYQPGKQTFQHFDADTQDEIMRLFPCLAEDIQSYGPSARVSLKPREVAPLLMAMAA